MKRIDYLVLYIATACVLAACGNDDGKRTATGSWFEADNTADGSVNSVSSSGSASNGATTGATTGASNGQLDVVVDPGVLDFAVNEIGVEQVLRFHVINRGASVLTLNRAEVVEENRSGGAEFESRDWPVTPVLAPQESMEFEVSYSPVDRLDDGASVELEWVDEDGNMGGAGVMLVAEGGGPSIAATPEVVLFEHVPPVDDASRDTNWILVEIRNEGALPLEIRDVLVAPASSDFSITFPSDADASPTTDTTFFDATTVPPGGVFLVRVYFNPVDDLPAAAELAVFSNDANRPTLTIWLRGNR